MFIEKFIKKAYISFYKDENYKFLCEIKKNHKIIESFNKEFNNKNDLTKEIFDILEEYPQTYISTFVTSLNQGIVPSCQKSEYKKREINLENIKFICIKNSYSFYISIYELINIKKEYPFEIDFIYSVFALIDYFAKKRDNYFYVLVLNEKIIISGYKDNKPIFYDIFELKEEKNEEIEEDVELLEDIDLDEEISENIEEEVQNLDLEDIEDNISSSSLEYNLINHLKSSIKDYYENYSNDFLEKIIYLNTINLKKDIKSLTEEELFIDSEIINFNALKILNELSERENV